ncbi:MAG TPA: hypothetical protein PK244_00365 [Pseudomonadales bacterium]|jgi:hypothetical protein|nr:hypothetical protein [Pseudomonadales bacterium]HRG51055.1 hypothetical protein [Pseudomonadales bacterium]
MKKILLSILIAIISCSAIAKDTIPTQFHGIFETEKSNCGNNIMYNYSDSGFEITGTGISGFEEGCTLKKAVSKTDTSFVGKFSCGGPDGDEVKKVTLTLSADKKAITTTGYFGGKKFRCK